MADETTSTTAAPAAAAAPTQAVAVPAKPAGTVETAEEHAKVAADALAAKAEPEAKLEEKKPDDKKPDDPAKPDPKAIAKEQERRMEERATKLRSELHGRAKALDEREKSLAAKEADLKELEQLRGAKALAKEDPIAYLESIGLTFEEVAKAAQEGTGADPAARKALAHAKALEKKLADKEKAEAEAKKKAEDEALSKQEREQEQTLLKTIDGFLEKGGDKFAYTRAFGAPADVRDAAFAYFKKTGLKPDLAKVAEAVEDGYRQQAQKAYELESKRRADDEAKKKPAAVAVPAAPAAPAESKDEKPKGKEVPPLRGATRPTRRSWQAELEEDLKAVGLKKVAPDV